MANNIKASFLVRFQDHDLLIQADADGGTPGFRRDHAIAAQGAFLDGAAAEHHIPAVLSRAVSGIAAGVVIPAAGALSDQVFIFRDFKRAQHCSEAIQTLLHFLPIEAASSTAAQNQHRAEDQTDQCKFVHLSPPWPR